MRIQVSLKLLFHHIRIYVNEVGLHVIPPENGAAFTEQSWYHSSARTESLIRCLQAAKNYLDYFLTLPPDIVVEFTMHDFLRLIYAVLILGSFATGCDSPRLDAARIRQISDLENYLNALSQNTMQAIATTPTTDSHGFLSYLYHLWQHSKPRH